MKVPQMQADSYKVKSFVVTNLEKCGSLSSDECRVFEAVSVDGKLTTVIVKPLPAVSNDSNKKVCPTWREGETVWATWDPVNGYWVDLNVAARRVVEHDNCDDFPYKLVQNFTVAGMKGGKGVSGIGAAGEKGESGDDGGGGEKGDEGAGGPKGEVGSPNIKGAKGSDGDDGETGSPLDLADSPVVKVDGVEFGARLMGICIKGEWKYVYVFASTPQTTT